MKRILQKMQYLRYRIFLLGLSIAFVSGGILKDKTVNPWSILGSNVNECGWETFDNAVFPGSSYGSGSFVGENGQVWNYTDIRSESTYGIDGKGALMRSGSAISTVLSKGIGKFSVKARKAFASNAQRRLELWINGQLEESFEPDFSQGIDSTIVNFVVGDINVLGGVNLEIRSMGGQITIDDVMWSCYSLTGNSQTIWNGNSWSNGIPTLDKEAVVRADYNSVGDISAKSILIESNIDFVLESGDVLYVGSIDVKGSLTVLDEASIIQNDSAVNIGKIKIYKKTAPLILGDDVFWASPVYGQNLYAFSPNTVHTGFYKYDSLSDEFSNVGIDSVSVFYAGDAFIVSAPEDFAKQAQIFEGIFEGTIHNGEYSIPVTNDGTTFNLIGNPYPSSIDANLFFAQNTNLTAAVYSYTNANVFDDQTQSYRGSNFEVYNLTGGVAADNSEKIPTSNIALGQGFMVEANSDMEVLFSNDMRVNPQQLPDSTHHNLEKHRIWIELTSPEGSRSQGLIGYIEGATNEKDRMYDASHLDQKTNSLSFLLEDERMTILGKALPFDVEDEIAISFTAVSAGQFRISLLNKDGIFKESQPVYIRDMEVDLTVEITDGEYYFVSEKGKFDNRFSLVFKNGGLSVEDSDLTRNIVIFQKNQVLFIQAGEAIINEVRVLDIQGKLVFVSKGMNIDRFEFAYSNYEKGVYFIYLMGNSGQKMSKKVIF